MFKKGNSNYKRKKGVEVGRYFRMKRRKEIHTFIIILNNSEFEERKKTSQIEDRVKKERRREF